MAGEGVFPKSNGDIVYASDFNRVNHLLNSATWATSFSTTSTSYVDVTSATVTLSGLDSNETYTFMAFADFISSHSADGQSVLAAMVIGSATVTESNDQNSGGTDIRSSRSLHGYLSGQTGITSITTKLQIKVVIGTGTINKDSLTNQRITVWAIPA